MKYLLPKELGGGEVVVLTDQEPTRNYDDYIWVRDSHLGLIQIDRTHLTPVAPPTPEEPPQGAYLIGDKLCTWFPGDQSEPHWIVQGLGWMSWTEVWEAIGGPDVTIQRLVVSPAEVELPWRKSFNDGDALIVDKSSASNRDVFVSGFAHLTAEDARSYARAILTAAGEP